MKNRVGDEVSSGFLNKQTVTALLVAMGLSGGVGGIASNRFTVYRMESEITAITPHMTLEDFSARLLVESPWLRDRDVVMRVVSDVRILRDDIGDIRAVQSSIMAKLDMLLSSRGLASNP